MIRFKVEERKPIFVGYKGLLRMFGAGTREITGSQRIDFVVNVLL